MAAPRLPRLPLQLPAAADAMMMMMMSGDMYCADDDNDDVVEQVMITAFETEGVVEVSAMTTTTAI